jgi:hypothetical protein
VLTLLSACGVALNRPTAAARGAEASAQRNDALKKQAKLLGKATGVNRYAEATVLRSVRLGPAVALGYRPSQARLHPNYRITAFVDAFELCARWLKQKGGSAVTSAVQIGSGAVTKGVQIGGSAVTSTVDRVSRASSTVAEVAIGFIQSDADASGSVKGTRA